MNIDNLRNAVAAFYSHARPSNGNPFSTCTIQDLNNAIDAMKKVLTAFVNELEAR